MSKYERERTEQIKRFRKKKIKWYKLYARFDRFLEIRWNKKQILRNRRFNGNYERRIEPKYYQCILCNNVFTRMKRPFVLSDKMYKGYSYCTEHECNAKVKRISRKKFLRLGGEL